MTAVDLFVVFVFVLVYAGMLLGELPGLALDRSGIALLGAISLIAGRRLSSSDAWQAIDTSTIALLFGLMVISAQFRLGGFYGEVVRRVVRTVDDPNRLLVWVIALAGGLSAVLANDIVCLAMAPMLIGLCAERRLAPTPFLLGLACASNIGSAATLIGNPQNMLIGQSLSMSFAGYLADGVPPAVIGLAISWVILWWQWRHRWRDTVSTPTVAVPAAPAFDRYQTLKGIAVLVVVVLAFVFAPWPRETVALAGAGVLLLSRRMASRDVIALIDWHLIVLFAGLFVLNDAVDRYGLLTSLNGALVGAGIDLHRPTWLFVLTPVLSNLVSNVPAVMLLLPSTDATVGGPLLALTSTFAGNLLVVGSIANIVVVEQAARLGVVVDWRAHARTGVPVTIATLAVAAAWLWLRA
jgi:Na+/H+ antiporter NhaD/arsenite permease-like protein